MNIDPENYLSKFKKGKDGKFLNALRDIISKKINRPFPQVAKLTQNWSSSMLKECAELCEQHPAKFWEYYKQTKV